MLEELMIELYDANHEQIQAALREYGTLPVRLAMLGIASSKKESSPFYYGSPPGVFISYKWDGEPMRQYVTALASHIRSRGYRVFLDVEELDENADNYTAVPQFITSVQECSYYVLLLTEKTADFITARKHKTSWIFDEFQHALRLVNAGRLLLVPLLVEEGGINDILTREMVIDISKNLYDYTKLDHLLPPNNQSLSEAEKSVLEKCLDDFDNTFLQEKFSEALAILLNHRQFSDTFDHQFRLMLYAIYTANQELLNGAMRKLQEHLPEQAIAHLYSGYCKQHGLPNRLVT
ncbi:MAG TPA: toll/interleukin-1 receptor domain-containing protein [Pyrinomonadaceae bacterium]